MSQAALGTDISVEFTISRVTAKGTHPFVFSVFHFQPLSLRNFSCYNIKTFAKNDFTAETSAVSKAMAGQAKDAEKEFFIRIPEKGILIKMSTISSFLRPSSAVAKLRRVEKQESSKFNLFRMPGQVRHDELETFYETINIKLLIINQAID